eukprot:m.130447 g.130447  ORF g.130447 m.130447 type:complete len:358 (+) comp23691_c0_seq1:79-1152(+)
MFSSGYHHACVVLLCVVPSLLLFNFNSCSPAAKRLPLFGGGEIQTLSDGYSWTEGPVWVNAGKYLLFSDVKKNTIHRFDSATGQTYPAFSPSGCFKDKDRCDKLVEPGSNGLAIDPVSGYLFMCQHGERRIAAVQLPDSWTSTTPQDISASTLVIATHGQPSKRLNSPNDLVFAPSGDLYFTDPSYGLPEKENDPERELDYNGVYVIPALQIKELLSAQNRDDVVATRVVTPKQITRPNGVALTSDGATLFISDTNRTGPHWQKCEVKQTDAIDCTPFASAKEWRSAGLVGSPDGMVVYNDRYLISTSPGGIRVFDITTSAHLGVLDNGEKNGNLAMGGDGFLYICANSKLQRIALQ